MDTIRMGVGRMEVIVSIVGKLVYFTYLGDVSNLLIGGRNNPFTKYLGHPRNERENTVVSFAREDCKRTLEFKKRNTGPRPKALKNGKKKRRHMYIRIHNLHWVASITQMQPCWVICHLESFISNHGWITVEAKVKSLTLLMNLTMMLNVPIIPKPQTNFPIVPIVQDELFVHRWNLFAALGKKKTLGWFSWRFGRFNLTMRFLVRLKKWGKDVPVLDCNPTKDIFKVSSNSLHNLLILDQYAIVSNGKYPCPCFAAYSKIP